MSVACSPDGKWVASDSFDGRVRLYDARTGAILGEYFSAPDGQPRNPSRTTVDLDGNVWTANRDGNSVVHIGNEENGQCVDRNGNPIDLPALSRVFPLVVLSDAFPAATTLSKCPSRRAARRSSCPRWCPPSRRSCAGASISWKKA